MNYNLLLVLLISVSTCAMDKATLAHQALHQPTSELFEELPAEVQECVAQWIIKDHPMVDYFKRSADFCTSTLQGHTWYVRSASFSSDGTTLVTASEDGTAKIWAVLTGNCLHTLGHTKCVNSANFSPDGTPEQVWLFLQENTGLEATDYGWKQIKQLLKENEEPQCSEKD